LIFIFSSIMFSTEVIHNKPLAGFAASKFPLERFLACVPT